MASLGVENALYACYSKETTTVLMARFDPDLWCMISSQVASLFGQNAKRPTKKSDTVVVLNQLITEYIENKVTFIAEVQSVQAENCVAGQGSKEEPYCIHAECADEDSSLAIFDIAQALHEVSKLFCQAYQLNRARATEFLGFMISDLDRMSCGTSLAAVPIAFGMKGYSMPNDILRNMLEFVLGECAKVGLYVPVCSFDGQWYKTTVRDQTNQPLTVLQLQKDVYQMVKKMPVSKVLSIISDRNVVRSSSLDDLTNIVDMRIDELTSVVEVGKKIEDDVVYMTPRMFGMVDDWKNGKFRKGKKKPKDPENEESDILNSLPVHVVDDLPESIIREVTNVSQTVTSLTPSNTSNVDGFHESLSLAEYAVVENITDEEGTTLAMGETTSQQLDETRHSVLNESDLLLMIDALQKQQTPKKDWKLSERDFRLLFSDAKKMDKSFTKAELIVALHPVLDKLTVNGVNVRQSNTKRDIIAKLSVILGDGSELAVRKKHKKTPVPLAALARSILSKFPKEILCCICAQYIFPQKLQEWYRNNPFGKSVNVEGLDDHSTWYSMPEYNSGTRNYLFMILDSYHQLCGARRLVCQTGIPARGINREVFVKIAEDHESNGCGLNLAMVNDMIDKQNAAFAKATFSEDVVSALEAIGETNAANFCKLFRNWYSAEDDPGISAINRCKHRLALKRWLLDGVRFNEFPPYGTQINGIPLVLFEGLLTNIERKIQLYTFSKTGTYNVRSVGSLDIENFFGTFQDIDPKGTGVLRPDDIPSALSVATELLEAKIDPNRGFHMDTTASKVYPVKPTGILPTDTKSNTLGSDNLVWRDLTIISPIDHAFDMEIRAKRKPKRKSSGVSKPQEPARGCQPIRQFHRRDESKILPHVRRGLNLDDLL